MKRKKLFAIALLETPLRYARFRVRHVLFRFYVTIGMLS
jgi:hypothetical protein